MQFDTLMEVAVLISNRFDTHWTLFISVHLALIGGIIYIDRPLDRTEKTTAILVYTGFAVMNGLMMMNQIMQLNSIYQDLIALRTHECCMHLKTLERIETVAQRLSVNMQLLIIIVVHLLMYVLVILSIVNDKTRRKNALSNQPK